ncbi:MAG: STAS domain-containing protein [Acidobacteria bacterium]|nr:STAS domain-containing protein [Acidobacteriota bacterium]
MKVHQRQEGEITVLDLEGRITIGEGDVILRDSIQGLLQSGHQKILLNMARIAYMDSSGVGELLGVFQSVTSHGGKLKLLNISTKIKDLLQITQLLSVFEYFNDEQKALNSFVS